MTRSDLLQDRGGETQNSPPSDPHTQPCKPGTASHYTHSPVSLALPHITHTLSSLSVSAETERWMEGWTDRQADRLTDR